MFEDLGPHVRRARRDRDLTQAQLARALGIRQQALSEIERGLRPPRTLLDRIARVMGVSSQALQPRPE